MSTFRTTSAHGSVRSRCAARVCTRFQIGSLPLVSMPVPRALPTSGVVRHHRTGWMRREASVERCCPLRTAAACTCGAQIRVFRSRAGGPVYHSCEALQSLTSKRPLLLLRRPLHMRPRHTAQYAGVIGRVASKLCLHCMESPESS
jgi:hypothetical protein